MSPSDAERVAAELFELARGNDVDESHVDALAGNYRRRLMGPRVIITATQVGEQVLAWQASGASAAVAATPPPPLREPSLDELLAGVDLDGGALPDLGLPSPIPPSLGSTPPTHHRAMSDAELNAYADPVGGRDPFALTDPPAEERDLSLDFDAGAEPAEVPYLREDEIEIGGDESPDLELNFDEILVGEELDARDFGAIAPDSRKKR